MSGHSPTEAIGSSPSFLKSGQTPEETHRRLWATIERGDVWRGELRNRRNDGTLFWEAASISPVRDAAGEIAHVVAVKEDVTERRITEERLLRTARGSLAHRGRQHATPPGAHEPVR